MRLLCISMVVLAAMPLCVWAATPSTKEPQGVFTTRPQALSERLLQDVLRLYSQSNEELTRYENNLAQGRYRQASAAEMKRISGTYVKVLQQGRVARDLQDLREPAGADMQLRNIELRQRVQEIVRMYKELPEASQLLAQAKPPSESLAKSNAKALEALDVSLGQGKLDLVERRLYELWDEVEQPLVWYDRKYSNKLREPFSEMARRLDAEQEKARLAHEELGAHLERMEEELKRLHRADH